MGKVEARSMAGPLGALGREALANIDYPGPARRPAAAPGPIVSAPAYSARSAPRSNLAAAQRTQFPVALTTEGRLQDPLQGAIAAELVEEYRGRASRRGLAPRQARGFACSRVRMDQSSGKKLRSSAPCR
jgi:hypothetical protein